MEASDMRSGTANPSPKKEKPTDYDRVNKVVTTDTEASLRSGEEAPSLTSQKRVNCDCVEEVVAVRGPSAHEKPMDSDCGDKAVTTDVEASVRSRPGKAPRLTSDESKQGGIDGLDAELWGDLQNHLPLRVIHDRLSKDELSRLRFVCKDWNRAALQRLLPKPYFVTITSGYHWEDEASYLNGIVTYDPASGGCSFKHQRSRLPWVESHVPPFEVEGLILCHTRGNKTTQQRGVFNVHNQTWHAIPPAPEKSKFRSACGLMVDTSPKPYTFKLIEGSVDVNTRIYDSESRSWSTTSSRLPPGASAKLNEEHCDDISYSCICHRGRVYISVEMVMIVIFAIEDDAWSTMEFPAVGFGSTNSLGFYIGEHNVMGVWEGRIFATTENCFKRSVTVWELVGEQLKWEEYARMSKKQYRWLYANNSVSHSSDLTSGAEMRLLSCFSDAGYLLVCCWQWSHARAEALALLSMAKKKWRKLENLPMGTVATYDSDSEEDEPDSPWYSAGATTDEEVHSADETEDVDTTEDW